MWEAWEAVRTARSEEGSRAHDRGAWIGRGEDEGRGERTGERLRKEERRRKVAYIAKKGRKGER